MMMSFTLPGALRRRRCDPWVVRAENAARASTLLAQGYVAKRIDQHTYDTLMVSVDHQIAMVTAAMRGAR